MSSDVSACESSAYKMWVRMDLPTGSVGGITADPERRCWETFGIRLAWTFSRRNWDFLKKLSETQADVSRTKSDERMRGMRLRGEAGPIWCCLLSPLNLLTSLPLAAQAA